jgi:hypothetical protein
MKVLVIKLRDRNETPAKRWQAGFFINDMYCFRKHREAPLPSGRRIK